MRILFVWQGFDGRYGMWKDGLYAAMKCLEETHDVVYSDFPLKGIEEFNPDVVLYWEAPVTQRGKDADNWNAVCALPYKKVLLFAGGPLIAMDVKDFDLVFVESAINEEDCERQGIPYKRAFGVNTQIMEPMNLEKKYEGIIAATFAGWKRHELFADALQSKGLAVGRLQEHDRNGYNRCVQLGVQVLGEVTPDLLAHLYNQSKVAVNTSEYWGGGQRMTLEAMACGIPVVVMGDSPKNREFVEASGAGLVSEPDPDLIRAAVDWLKDKPQAGRNGIEYINDNWTEQHYAKALEDGILSI